MSAAPTSFDVQAFVRDPIDLRPADLDLEAMSGLSASAVEVLSHLWTLERGVLDLLRDLLVTPTHAEGRVTAFLGTWAYEQYWLTQSLAALIEVNGSEPSEPPDTTRGKAVRVWDERFSPTIRAVRTNLLGSDIVASYMTTGWLSTAVMDLGYRRLVELEPRLAPLAEAVAPIKARHLAFYRDDAHVRLARSEKARGLARRALSTWQWPGVRYAGTGAVLPVLQTLYADPGTAPRLRAIDADLGRLPGLTGLLPVQHALGSLARA